jgi:hypothetical protein
LQDRDLPPHVAPEAIVTALLALGVFAASLSIDFANTRYVRAVTAIRPCTAAGWSLAQWFASLVGFLVAFKITLWMLPFEGLGLACGCWLSLELERRKLARGPRLRAVA